MPRPYGEVTTDHWSAMPSEDTPYVITVDAEVNAPITTVFEVLEDLELFAELDPLVRAVTFLSPQRRGSGVSTRWEMWDPDANTMVESSEEVVLHEPPVRFGYTGSFSGNRYAGTHSLTENPDGTTQLHFVETFYFDADRDAYRAAVDRLILNIKGEAERRASVA